MRDVRIAAVCMTCVPGDIEGNLRKAEYYVSEASAQGAQIVCFPELSVSGYTLRNPSALCSSRGGKEVTRRIEALARAGRVIILAGFVEVRKGRKPFISQMVAGPAGLLGVYRKTHLSPTERKLYQPGGEINVFQGNGVRFGVQLCYEAHFPEISTLLALKGAEILFLPHASPRGTPEEKFQSWSRHLPGRAFDNSLYVVACNQVGRTSEGLSFPGVSLVVDPAGQVVASRKENSEGMLLADLSADTLRKARKHRMRYFLPARRPELYGLLALPPREKRTQKKGTQGGSSPFCALSRKR
ncbi:MAG: nitrilase [Deltaproteobacteria bacterium]|nr:nitrilase [Deltaproteobacteria bacterium]